MTTSKPRRVLKKTPASKGLRRVGVVIEWKMVQATDGVQRVQNLFWTPGLALPGGKYALDLVVISAPAPAPATRAKYFYWSVQERKSRT
jgi:hypothetical protein